MIEHSEVQSVISKIENASSFNDMGYWAMKLNEIKMSETERRELFYTIDFPFAAKAEFIDGSIYIQEYPWTEE